MTGSEQRLTVYAAYGILGRTPIFRRGQRTSLEIEYDSFFEAGPSPGLEPVGGEFQPSVATGYSVGGAQLLFSC